MSDDLPPQSSHPTCKRAPLGLCEAATLTTLIAEYDIRGACGDLMRVVITCVDAGTKQGHEVYA